MRKVKVIHRDGATSEETYLRAIVAQMASAVLPGRDSIVDDPRAVEVDRLARRVLTPGEYRAALTP